MAHLIALSDEQYATLERLARERGTTIEAALGALVEGLRDPRTEPRYYETDDWLRHLGMSEERIARANARLRATDPDVSGASSPASEVAADADAR